MSLPAPPKTRSLPSPPVSWSSPPRPQMRSLPALPSIVSATLVPRRRSLPGPPVIVAASAVAGTMASAAVAPMMVLRSCMWTSSSRRSICLLGGGCPFRHRLSQCALTPVLTHREEFVRGVGRSAAAHGTCVILMPMSSASSSPSSCSPSSCGPAASVVHARRAPGRAARRALRDGAAPTSSTAAAATTGSSGGAATTGSTAGPAPTRVAGDAGSDRLNGGPGDDTLLGGAGNDRITGGAGRDDGLRRRGQRRHQRPRRRARRTCTAAPGRDRVIADAGDVVAATARASSVGDPRSDVLCDHEAGGRG